MKECAKETINPAQHIRIMKSGHQIKISVFLENNFTSSEGKGVPNVGMMKRKIPLSKTPRVLVRKMTGSVILGFTGIKTIFVSLLHNNT